MDKDSLLPSGEVKRRHLTLLVVSLLLACTPAASARPLPEAGEPIADAPTESSPATTTGSPGTAPSTAAPAEPVVRSPSRALGRPNRGKLVRGVPLPPVSAYHVTWDPILKQVPNRLWRRWATDRTVQRVLRVLWEYHEENPDAPPVLVGDLSRKNGGDFGARVGGGLGHASHQNGLDVDVYYPRLDGLLRAPPRPAQVDRVAAQELVDRFVDMGAVYVFVGLRVRPRGPKKIVQPIVYHDDHMHVRFAP